MSRDRQLILDLFDAGCIRFGQFTLVSGLVSPIYIDLRLLPSRPDVLWRVARAYSGLLAGLAFDRMAAIPYAALPIGSAVAVMSSVSGGGKLYHRRDLPSPARFKVKVIN